MKISRIFFFLVLCFLGSACAYSTQNVIILVIDGPRYTETFGDASHQFIPKMWNQLRPLGTLYTRFYNDTVTETVPGHCSIVTGSWQVIKNTGDERPHAPTIFEYFRKERGTSATDNYVILGKNHLEILSYSDYSQYGTSFGASVKKPVDSKWTDTAAWNNITEILSNNHPRLAIVNLPQVDLTGHNGDSLGYLNAIKFADSIVNETWNFLQGNQFYKNKTTLMVTCDHGRHSHDYRDHRGDGCEGCRHCMLLMLGPDTKAEIVDSTRYRQIDIAPTIGRLLDFSLPFASGKVIESACPPLPPSLVSPLSNASDLSIDPSVIWNRAAGNATYQLQVSVNADLASPLVDRASLSDTVQATGKLDYATRYYWRVKASGAGGESDWSPTLSFTTVIALPAIPSLASPASDTNCQSTSPVLAWNAAARAASYDVQIAGDSVFSNPVTPANGLTTTDYHAHGLEDNTVYFWRVRAKNAGGTSEWSKGWKFITEPGIHSIPQLVSPPNRADNQPVAVVLSWQSGVGALSYGVQVSKSDDFTTQDTAVSGLIDTFFALTGLENKETYYLRVKSQTLGGSSNWSPDRRFTTIIAAPETPTLSAPAHDAIGQPRSPILSWTPPSRAAAYAVQIARDTGFSDTITPSGRMTGSSFTPDSLDDNTVYWWRVQAINEGGRSEWSSKRKFTTIPGKSAIPKLSCPVNDTGNQPIAMTLSWHSTNAAMSYGIQIAASSDFVRTIADTTGIVDTGYACSGLANDSTYFWRVKTIAAGGATEWSDTWKFKTIVAAPKTPPSCIAPNDRALCVPVALALRWQSAADASSYRVQVAHDSLFDKTIRDTAGVTDTSFSLAGLANNTPYFWRIQSLNRGGSSEWSMGMKFVTIIALPGAPTPIFPAHNCCLQTDSLCLMWAKASPNVARYWIEYCPDSTMSDATIDSTFTDTSKLLLHLKDNTVFWWRLKAYNEAGWSDFSVLQRFIIQKVGVLPGSYSLKKFSLSRARGTISYDVPVACNVHVQLFDVKGKLLKKIDHIGVLPGSYTDHVTLSSLPMGNYFLKFRAGAYLKSCKVLMMH